MNSEILKIAIPSIISNITVPLLGLVDIAITGHLGNASYIGAIAIGSTIFNIIYWLFSFLKMGTGGLTAQAYGTENQSGYKLILLRSLSIALTIAVVLLLMQTPIFLLAKHILNIPADVVENALLYFRILIWGAPAILCMYCFTGWFLGMQNARFPMWIAIIQNLVNIGASLFFVLILDMKVEGIALGTLIAQYSGLFLALLFWAGKYRSIGWKTKRSDIFDAPALSHFFKVNRAIFLRTLCLIIVSTSFTAIGAAAGSTLLAANTVLMQFFLIFSYVVDGFAYAGEALGGRFYGARDAKNYNLLVGKLINWGLALALLFTIVYSFFGEDIIRLLTNEVGVVSTAISYLLYVALIPLTSFLAFTFDGLFIGTTNTRAMLWSMLIATSLFFATYFAYKSSFGNHALWWAFLAYLFARSLVCAIFHRFAK